MWLTIGGGSPQVYSVGGVALLESPIEGGPRIYFRFSPMQALAAHTRARVVYEPGTDIKAAAKFASGETVKNSYQDTERNGRELKSA